MVGSKAKEKWTCPVCRAPTDRQGESAVSENGQVSKADASALKRSILVAFAPEHAYAIEILNASTEKDPRKGKSEVMQILLQQIASGQFFAPGMR